jgi:DNA-binding NarL/FixJ family response regulator
MASEKATRVLVVAPGRLHREGLGLLIGSRPRLEVIATAGCAEAALALIGEHAPDAVLVDLAEGGLSVLRAVAPHAKVVALGPWDDDATLVACAGAGVAGYADVDGSVDQLEQVLDGLERDELACSPALASTLVRRLGALAGGAPAHPRVTPREREILALVDEGLSNKEIAARLQIRVATVKNHVHNVLEKLQVNGRSAAAARVRELRVPEAAGFSSPRAP